MMILHTNYDLTRFNTMGLPSIASQVLELNTISDIEQIDEQLLSKPRQILGCASNLLLPAVISQLVILPKLLGIDVIMQRRNSCIVQVAAGELWHDFVLWSVNRSLWGIENLSLIPGTVGAAPVQNIGAYGVELKDVLLYVKGYSFQQKKHLVISNSQCQFGYRNSAFKAELKQDFLITHVAFKLSKLAKPQLNYSALTSDVESLSKEALTSKMISDRVIAIRNTKLPDPKQIGNVGSFFKNPIVSWEELEKLRQKYVDIVAYPVNETSAKLAAGWLIEKAGFKGRQFGSVGVSAHQALVLVNSGGASLANILALADKIQSTVNKLFGVNLEMEVGVVGEGA